MLEIAVIILSWAMVAGALIIVLFSGPYRIKRKGKDDEGKD